MSHRTADGSRVNAVGTGRGYRPPKRANPGNLVHAGVGGGHLGSRLAHGNEAPFPEALPAFFVASLCPPGGLVLDPFGGSGSTAAAARSLGRRAVVADFRQSQCELSRRWLANVTPGLPFPD
jgi:hypothetical protein